MPLYSIEGPDGKIYSIEGPEGATREEVIDAIQYRMSEMPSPPKKKKGLGADVMRGIEDIVASSRTGIEALFGDKNVAAESGLARKEGLEQKYEDQVSLEKVKEAYKDRGTLAAAGEVVRQVPHAIAGQAPQIATMGGGAMLGSRIGSVFGLPGTVIGGAVGAGLGSLAQQFGTNIERQAQEQKKAGQPVDVNLQAAGAGAVPQAALDVVEGRLLFGNKLISGLLGIPEKQAAKMAADKLEALAAERLVPSLLKGTAKGIAAEIPTEITQQLIERAQAGLPLFDKEAMDEYTDTAYQVGLLGPLGAIGRFADKSTARTEKAKREVEEAERQRAEEERIRLEEQERLRQEALAPTPFTPLTSERDIAGVRPEGRLPAQAVPIVDPNTGKITGYEAPPAGPPLAPELTGVQAPLPLQPQVGGQFDLFPGGPEPLQPTPTATPTPIPEPVPPVPLGDFLKDVVKDIKADIAAPKILKMNSPVTAKVVEDRISENMPEGVNQVQAMENLYTGVTDGTAKALTEPQMALLEAAYKRMTNMDITEGIRNRALQAAPQADIFAEGEAAPAPSTEPVTPRDPEKQWNDLRNDDHPEFSALSPQEQQQWVNMVNRGVGTPVNFQDIARSYTERTKPAPALTPYGAPRTGTPGAREVPEITPGSQNLIGDKVRGKQAFQVAEWIAKNGPEQFRELAAAIAKRLKFFKSQGFQYRFQILTPERGRSMIASGTAGSHRYRSDANVFRSTITLPPQTATVETVLHELLHATTTPAIMYIEQGYAKDTELGKLVQELDDVAQVALGTLIERVNNGTATPFEQAVFRGPMNALGNLDRNRANIKREIISWAMTNPDMQVFLESVPYKNKNLFSAIVEAFRKFLGLSPRADTALYEVMRVTNEILGAKFSEMQQAAIEAGVPLPTPKPTKGVTKKGAEQVEYMISKEAPAPTTAPPRLTKLQPAPTTGQSIKDTTQKAKDAFAGDWWTKFRIAAIDPSSGLAKTLSSLPIFQNGQLRADMLLRSFNQVINLIKNGLQSGIPVLNADGSVVIQRDKNNLRRSQIMADALDTNPTVKASGMSGRAYVGEIARILRGEEIMQIDAERRQLAKLRLAEAAIELRQAYSDFKQGSISRTALNKAQSYAKATQKRYKPDLNLNREKQVKPEHIAWANEQLKRVPEVEQIFDVWRDINTRLVDLWQATGLLTAEHADNLRKQTRYVPLYASRIDLLQEEQEAYTGKATGTKTVAEIDRLEGSELVRNIWENMDKHYAFMTAKAFQNQTRKVAVQQLMTAGIDAARYAENPDDANLRYKDPSDPNADKNGVVHIILDNPNDLAAFQMMHYELTPIMKGLSATTQVLRAGALINPMYWIKQLIRDPIHANIAGNLNQMITPFHAAKEYLRILANNSEEARILAERGVIGQIDPTIDLHDFLKQVGTEKLSPSMVDKWAHKVMRMHEASDAATRVSIFKSEKALALKQGMSEQEATDYAVHKARESINFAVRGNSKTLNALRHMIPFFSAAITSLDTLYRSATGYGLNEQEKKTAQTLFAKRAAMMVVLSSAYAMMMQDDDDYKKLPDNVKDSNWLLPSPIGSEHTFIKVPVPFEVGFLFKTLPEGAIRYMADTSTGKEVLASYMQGVLRNLPGEGVLIPQAAKPALEAITNYSFFTGRPIEGMSDQGLPVAERGPNASEISKIFSKMGLDKLGFSPAKIDHLTQGYFAELGTFFAGVSSNMITAAEGKTPPTKNIEESPFFKNFLTNPNTSDAATDFYDIMQNAQETVNAFNRMKKTGRIEEAKELLSDEEKRKLIAVAPSLRKIQDQMSKIRENITRYKNAYDMDPDMRRDKINDLQTMYDRVAKQGYKVLEAAGIER